MLDKHDLTMFLDYICAKFDLLVERIVLPEDFKENNLAIIGNTRQSIINFSNSLYRKFEDNDVYVTNHGGHFECTR